ncbi:histidinol dehydrogenase [Cenarchaeum symbiosum A]|uniref:Histidinol dehydrogenase n=1 Tax=Cenarchaeum symbiosum (strain A) TaxID=414004 RepID=A0RZ72_CENSY|nr:histidinol dehydrogenase [Cenarchaeum symbiosum A]
MIRIARVRDAEKFASSARPRIPEHRRKDVQKIIEYIRKGGDAALQKTEARFGSRVSSFRVTKKEIQAAYSIISRQELAAVKASKIALERTERATLSGLNGTVMRHKGTIIHRGYSPISSVGCYVPGGLAKYPSSAIMSVVPARIAGVPRIVVATPPDRSGSIDPLTLVAADACGATEIYKTGGAQAVAALSYGTRTIHPVDKIVGPGGLYVTLAKSLVSGDTAIDMLAGPTELAILADSSSDARHIAADLISQAEHSSDTSCYVITNSASKAREIDGILSDRMRGMPRSGIIRPALKNNGFIAVCTTMDAMVKLANMMAPEHLEVLTKKPRNIADRIRTAGLVLVGPYTPSSASDYMLGTNHILPTGGSGRARGSLSVLDFLRLDTQVESTRAGLRRISGHLRTLSAAEGLDSHHKAVEERL